MPTATNSSTLVGRIYYNITKNNHDNNSPCSNERKKHPRSWEDDGKSSDKDNDHRGFIFIPNESSAFTCHSKGNEFHLVIPYSSLKVACYSAATEKLVHISQYSLICYQEDDWGELIFSTSCNVKRNADTEESHADERFVAIEVHENGISFESSETTTEQSNGKEDEEVSAMTLDALAKKEAENMLSSDGANRKKKSIGKEPVNVTGIVDAISPILVNDANEEPFAMMELYQLLTTENNAEAVTDVRSTVAIIRGGKALCMHPAIHPGQTITLMGIKSRKWKVPDVFQTHLNTDEVASGGSRSSELYQRLNHRVPDRVLVVMEATSIHWNDGYAMTQGLPSTIHTLTSIKGIVKSVNYQLNVPKDSKRKASHVAHFVTLKLLEPNEYALEEKLARIYLPKYPLPPNLLLGLQTGAILRAVNIHYVSSSPTSIDSCEFTKQVNSKFRCYVACLRSTIAIDRCAGESYHSTRFPSYPWFVPRQEKIFLMLPAHRITDMCSDPFNSKSSEQYFAEDKLRRELLVQAPGLNIDSLLEHHHRTATIDILSNNKSQSKGCNCSKRNSNTNYCGQKQSTRDPYAEFFDHAHGETSTGLSIECGTSCERFSSYNHFYNCTPTSVPLVIDQLETLRNACAQNMVNRVAISIKFNQERLVSSGWTSSHHFEGLDLCQILNSYSQSQQSTDRTWYDVSNNTKPNFYVCKVIADSDSEHTTTSFRDDSCVLPFCEQRNNADWTLPFKFDDKSFFWMQLNSVVVSCICLGSSQKEHANNEYHMPVSATHACSFLPSMVGCDGDSSSQSKNDGHGFVFVLGNLIFIASVGIVAKSIVPMDRSYQLREKAEAVRVLRKPQMKSYCKSLIDRTGLCSVRDCLEQSTSDCLRNNTVSIIGRLVRQRFTFRKLKSAQYEGWAIVLSHIDPSTNNVLEDASVLQTIEVKVSVPISKSFQASSDALKVTLARVISGSTDIMSPMVTPDQITMGLAWLIASGNSRTFPLLSGGWDESHNLCMEHDSSPSVCLEIPYTSRSFSKLGYQRFRCNLSDMKSFFVSESISHTIKTTNSAELCGASKFLPGLLNRRLTREQPLVFNTAGTNDRVFYCRNRVSLLARLKRNRGVNSATLAELHWEICNALKEGDHSYLRPSLLRRIHNAKISGISFCRARAECTKCFQVLSKSSSVAAEKKKKKSRLSCPSGCSHLHADVKWECSAIIDDGTGQAKIYAEREAALLLLGGRLDVTAIEEGAWEMEGGVFFQPAIPASSFLMQCIKDATFTARRCIAESKLNKKKESDKEDLPSTFSLLPTDAKAEYLLHQYCRQWYQFNHSRKMDLFCRCKPLSEDVTTVNQTGINIAKAMIAKVGLDYCNSQTASLPPLKLTLEDACLASEESYDDHISGWNHFSSHFI